MLRVELDDGRFGSSRRQAMHTGDPSKDAAASGHVEVGGASLVGVVMVL